jgi:hypothetical protein
MINDVKRGYRSALEVWYNILRASLETQRRSEPERPRSVPPRVPKFILRDYLVRLQDEVYRNRRWR